VISGLPPWPKTLRSIAPRGFELCDVGKFMPGLKFGTTAQERIKLAAATRVTLFNAGALEAAQKPPTENRGAAGWRPDRRQ